MAHCYGIRQHVRRDGFLSFRTHFIWVAPLALGETDQAGHVKVEGHSLVVQIAVLIVKVVIVDTRLDEVFVFVMYIYGG